MVRILLCALTLWASSAFAAIVPVLPVGDGTFYDVTGSMYDSFSSTETSNQAHYSYYGTSDTYDGRTSWAQFSLSGLSSAGVTSVTLNINLENRYLTGSTATCGSIMHVANSSGANGTAAQRLGGTELVSTILLSTPLGWNAFDVTTYVINDLNAGYAWSAFSFERDGTGDYSNRNAGYSFSSGDTAAAPYLAVVVPEPGFTGIAALIGLALLRHRRSQIESR